MTGRVRNSIVSSFGPSIDCAGLDIAHGIVDVEGLEFDGGWFVSMVSDSGQLVDPHLSDAGHAAVHDLARRGLGDPLVDYDGQARSGIVGTVEPAGHDRP